MDFDLTRFENDARLLAEIKSIETAENIQVLVPFAKAYLGMFYVIDNELPEKEKLKLLANETLANALLKGFVNCIFSPELPGIEEIGQKKAKQQEIPQGYAVLAGMDLISKKSSKDIGELADNIIESAIGFYLSNKNSHKNIWFDVLFKTRKETVTTALCKYWVEMLKNKSSYLPAINYILAEKPDETITQYCILPLLENWSYCKEKTLFKLLSSAFKYSAPADLLLLCEKILQKDELLTEKTRLYWIATAYLISPEKYFAKLSDYVGRVKLKIMPLLDFITQLMKSDDVNISFSDKLVAQILRLIAPIFPPQFHVYGALGGLDINSKNVMLMFYFLACSEDKNILNEIKLLQKARTMKIYSSVLDNLIEIQTLKNNDPDFNLPHFDTYLKNLVNNNKLQGRSNKFDLR